MESDDSDRAEAAPAGAGRDFVRQIVEDDLAAGRHATVVTRFPPEPNGFLHIGHAKAICLDFGIAAEYGGRCHLRFDDTNPETEDPRYVESIRNDVRWLGFDWGEHEYYASDYFEQLYDWSEFLINKGQAYVDDLDDDAIRAHRGSVSEPGTPSPWRDRSVQENLDLFRRMRAGEFPDGAKVLRARIDLTHPNMKMRDPLMYRIRHAHHYRRGDDWCIYPFYDWAHGQSDAIEGITHSLCTLEFDNNRELYDWYVRELEIAAPPHQYEFARLNVDYTITSKRKLLRLVSEGHVAGWDDPRMPTIAGMRRRGITPEALRRFCDLVGVSKTESQVDASMLEYAVRDDLNYKAPRVMCVLRPLKVIITNWPVGEFDWLEAPYWPHDVPREGSREVPFARELLIERDDFMENPSPGFHRLVPGGEVRLRYAYVIRCDEVVKDAAGEPVELRCSYDPDSRGGAAADGRRVKGTLHWVSAFHAVDVQVRLYDRLFAAPSPGAGERDLIDDLNADSLIVVPAAKAEPTLRDLGPGEHVQFERLGYFFTDPVDSVACSPAFNRVVTLRDSWGKRAEAADEAADAMAPQRAVDSSTAPSATPTRRRRSSADARTEARAADADLAAAFVRFRDELGLSEEDADVLTGDADLAAFFAAAASHGNPAAVARWTINEVLRVIKDSTVGELRFTAAALAELAQRADSGALHGAAAKQVFALLAQEGGDVAAIVARLGLEAAVGVDAIVAAIDELMAANSDKVEAYRRGRDGLLGFFVGGVMRATGGKADPQDVQRVVRQRLQGS